MNATRLKVTKLDEDQMEIVMCYEPRTLDVITQAEELDTEVAAMGMTIDKQTVYDLFSTFGGSEEGLKNIEVGAETANAWLEGDKRAPLRLYSLLKYKG